MPACPVCGDEVAGVALALHVNACLDRHNRGWRPPTPAERALLGELRLARARSLPLSPGWWRSVDPGPVTGGLLWMRGAAGVTVRVVAAGAVPQPLPGGDDGVVLAVPAFWGDLAVEVSPTGRRERAGRVHLRDSLSLHADAPRRAITAVGSGGMAWAALPPPPGADDDAKQADDGGEAVAAAQPAALAASAGAPADAAVPLEPPRAPNLDVDAGDALPTPGAAAPPAAARLPALHARRRMVARRAADLLLPARPGRLVRADGPLVATLVCDGGGGGGDAPWYWLRPQLPSGGWLGSRTLGVALAPPAHMTPAGCGVPEVGGVPEAGGGCFPCLGTPACASGWVAALRRAGLAAAAPPCGGDATGGAAAAATAAPPPVLSVAAVYVRLEDARGSDERRPSWSPLHRAAADGAVGLLKALIVGVGAEYLLLRTRPVAAAHDGGGAEPTPATLRLGHLSVLDAAVLAGQEACVQAIVAVQPPSPRVSRPHGLHALHYAVLRGAAGVLRLVASAVVHASTLARQRAVDVALAAAAAAQGLAGVGGGGTGGGAGGPVAAQRALALLPAALAVLDGSLLDMAHAEGLADDDVGADGNGGGGGGVRLDDPPAAGELEGILGGWAAELVAGAGDDDGAGLRRGAAAGRPPLRLQRSLGRRNLVLRPAGGAGEGGGAPVVVAAGGDVPVGSHPTADVTGVLGSDAASAAAAQRSRSAPPHAAAPARGAAGAAGAGHSDSEPTGTLAPAGAARRFLSPLSAPLPPSAPRRAGGRRQSAVDVAAALADATSLGPRPTGWGALDVPDALGRTPLAYAAALGNAAAVSYLLAPVDGTGRVPAGAGACPGAMDAAGDTPVMHALRGGRADLALLMLADVQLEAAWEVEEEAAAVERASAAQGAAPPAAYPPLPVDDVTEQARSASPPPTQRERAWFRRSAPWGGVAPPPPPPPPHPTEAPSVVGVRVLVSIGASPAAADDGGVADAAAGSGPPARPAERLPATALDRRTTLALRTRARSAGAGRAGAPVEATVCDAPALHAATARCKPTASNAAGETALLLAARACGGRARAAALAVLQLLVEVGVPRTVPARRAVGTAAQANALHDPHPLVGAAGAGMLAALLADVGGETPLHAAAKRGCGAGVRALTLLSDAAHAAAVSALPLRVATGVLAGAGAVVEPTQLAHADAEALLRSPAFAPVLAAVGWLPPSSGGGAGGGSGSGTSAAGLGHDGRGGRFDRWHERLSVLREDDAGRTAGDCAALAAAVSTRGGSPCSAGDATAAVRLLRRLEEIERRLFGGGARGAAAGVAAASGTTASQAWLGHGGGGAGHALVVRGDVGWLATVPRPPDPRPTPPAPLASPATPLTPCYPLVAGPAGAELEFED